MWVTGGVGQTPSPVTGIPVLTQCSWPAGAGTDANGGTGLTDGTIVYGVRQILHTVLVDCDDLSFLFAFAGSEEHAALPIDPGIPSNGGTLGMTIWKQSTNPNSGGTPINVTFGAGVTSYTWSPEQIVKTDPIAGPWHAGDQFVSRTAIQVTAGGRFPLGTKTVNATTGVIDGFRLLTSTPGTDYLHTGTVPANVNGAIYASFGPCGSASDTVHAPTPVVGHTGTSIDEGYNENTNGHQPDIIQALNNARIPSVRVARGGESALMFDTAGNHEIRMALLGQCTDIVSGHLVNDFKQYSDWVSCATVIRAHAQILRGAAGTPRIWWLTAPPSYTKDNVTPNDHSATIRCPVNDWERTGMPESAGGVPVASGTPGAVPSSFLYQPTDGLGAAVFERADVNETTRNSGLWKAGYSGDFTHPNSTGHAAGAAAFNVQRFWTAFGGPPPPPPPPPPAAATNILNLQKLGGSLVRL